MNHLNLIKKSFILIIILSLSISVQAKKKKRSKKRKSYQIMVVVENGVSVYQSKNFDSPVIKYLPKGLKVKAGRKVYAGSGGFGSFYKIKISKGKYGYVSDIDLKSRNGKKNKTNSKSKSSGMFSQENSEDVSFSKLKKPMYFANYFGATLSMNRFTEKFLSTTQQDDLLYYGVRLLGPDSIAAGVPLDLSLTLHLGIPAYYDYVTIGSGDGMIINFDSIFYLPLRGRGSWDIYYGVGLSVIYSSFQFKVYDSVRAKNQAFDSQEVRLGAVGMLSGVIELSKRFMFRVDGKYIYDTDPHFSIGGSVLTRY